MLHRDYSGDPKDEGIMKRILIFRDYQRDPNNS